MHDDDTWNDFNAGTKPTLNFGACSGATMDTLLRDQLDPGDPRDVDFHKFGHPHLAILTITGNDAMFSQ